MPRPTTPDPTPPDPSTPAPSTPAPTGAASAPGSRRPSRRTVLATAIPAVLAVGAAGALGSPRPAMLGERTGDTALADALGPHLGGHRRVAAVLLEPDGSPRFAGFGADEHREFEIGSITKTVTAALALDAIAQGALTEDSTVADVLGDRAASSAIADVTVRELTAHTSGIPSLPAEMGWGTALRSMLRKNPYAGRTPDDVIDAALSSAPSGRGTYAYSNLGTALEGQLVATALGTPWHELVRTRLVESLGLTETRVPRTVAELGDDAPAGHVADGHGAAPWPQDGYAPAGGVRSTTADMATYLASMIDGTNPGAAGIEPTVEIGEGQGIGFHWVTTTTADGQRLVWHNGMTGGFASFGGWNRETGRGVVLLTDSAISLDGLAVAVLTGEVAA
ncbi:serine hydrolase domain-containing protein [Brachybacterium huguangmaarense]